MLRSLRAASRCEAVKALAAPQCSTSAGARRHHPSGMSPIPKVQQACFSSGVRALLPVNGRSYATAAEAVDLSAPPSPIDSFLQGGAANYVDEMYIAWKANPKDVHVSWQTYFRNMEDPTVPAAGSSDAVNYLKAQNIARAFQEYGHTKAKINPLGDIASGTIHTHPDLPSSSNLSKYGFTTADLDREIPLGPDLFPHLASTAKTMPLRDIIATCEKLYSGSFGVEYRHISDPAKRDWIRQRVETYHASTPSPAEKQRILDTLIWATSLERFLATKFPNEKRFGLDGAEGLAPGLAALIDRCADVHGVKDIVIGSCHRGRMNVMSTVYGKDFETLFRQFAGTEKFDVEGGQTGDVKYHFGMEGEKTTAGGGVVGVEMLPNPSHLEAVDPVAQGKAKAVQEIKGDVDQSKVMFMALHGDAAFSGQGLVYETLNLSALKGYEVGGTVRLMVNNQIGFTTDSPDSRSTPYCSDLAKYIEAPIFHVNADDPEAVVFLCKLAADWRAEFRSDIVIDVNCYRRFGHNEIDQASFTQPEMYKKIAAQPALLEKYIEKLVGEGTMQAEVVEEQKRWVWEQLEEKLARSKLPVEDLKMGDKLTSEPSSTSTAVEETTLSTIAEAITSVPEGFNLHRNLQRILAAKKQAFDAGVVDWSTAEALAFGSLVLEGKPVRISGQDVERGTFSQRHSVLHDQTTHAEYTPLNHLQEGQPARYTAVNSPLSEFGVLGFDYGYSLAARDSLVMWEAQFGDFANNAQVVIDQFIASGEAKWLLKSGLVMSLPHGYDGQGPEHSSARLGRFLELGSEDPRVWPEDLERARRECNVRIVYMTTPANLFHVLRRQVYSPHKKPLIIFFSKSLLRHPLARSSVQELTGTSTFQPVLSDPEHGNSILPREETNRVILCSGQVYASLHKHREAKGIKDTAITRIEELHPFPWAEVKENLDSYPNAQTIVWCQEEPYNGGAWQYMRDRLETAASESENHKFSRIVCTQVLSRGIGSSPEFRSEVMELVTTIHQTSQDVCSRMEALGQRLPTDKTQERMESLRNMKKCIRSSARIATTASSLSFTTENTNSVAEASEFHDFLTQPNPDTIAWITTTSKLDLVAIDHAPSLHSQPVTLLPAHDLSDSDDDMEREIATLHLKRGRQAFDGDDLSTAERLLRKGLDRLKASKSHKQHVEMYREGLSDLATLYRQQGKWRETKEIINERLSLLSRTATADSTEVLKEKLTLAEVLLQLDDLVEARLHARACIKAYHKLGLEGREDLERSLNMMIRICARQHDTDGEE
uniref:2-oxoglutarate dehydrogenase, mitochondrial n=1 Tax=Colletotrichum fructicola (strain Nara gc5) TaxID=1213859 RepID=L2FAL8_COLFN